MKLTDFKYERPSYEAIAEEIKSLMTDFEETASVKRQIEIIHQVSKIRSTIDTMETLAYVRHTAHTKAEFYENENAYWDEQEPLYEVLFDEYDKVLAKSPFRSDLKQELGQLFFEKLDCKLQSFSPDIVEDLQEENKLQSQYEKMMAEAMVQFKGEQLTLEDLEKYKEDPDRKLREEATHAYYQFFDEHEEVFDEIFDQLVKLRTQMAQKLGFDNFVELGYLRMKRAYTPQAVQKFREQVLEHIVPVATSIFEAQRERLGYEELRYFDRGFKYLTGNPTPKGDPDWILEQGANMYRELSTETAEFFDLMMERECFDVINRPGKCRGGYCANLLDYKMPFIFANFNSTIDDIDTLTHEAGHAFQYYQSRHIELVELCEPTDDSAEIHSMSMEFLTWPWMENFFKEDTKKYKYSHLSRVITDIPYIIAIDAYQHTIYENPELTPKERKAVWLGLENTYLPHLNHRGCGHLERGNGWRDDLHIYIYPFYYIDYALASICALQFWKKMHDNKEEAWNDYMRICQVGGTKSYPELVQYGNLKSPFEEGCVSSMITDVKEWLDRHKDVE